MKAKWRLDRGYFCLNSIKLSYEGILKLSSYTSPHEFKTSNFKRPKKKKKKTERMIFLPMTVCFAFEKNI